LQHLATIPASKAAIGWYEQAARGYLVDRPILDEATPGLGMNGYGSSFLPLFRKAWGGHCTRKGTVSRQQ